MEQLEDGFFSWLMEQKIELPFEIKLQDFRLLKYPGSESPSSYESDLTIVDTLKDKEDDYNLFMNHGDYDGYRFFQSSMIGPVTKQRVLV